MEQLTLDFNMSYYAFNKPIRLIELFAGIGTQAMALKRLGVKFEYYRMVEFDKYCLVSYNAIHDTSFITTDVREVKSLHIKDTDKYDYIVTYSFPCTDLSLAGKGKGMVKGDSTRSGLLWEVERLLDVSDELPRVLLMENVPQILSVKHKPQFNEWQNFLARKGYTNHVLRMNAKDYGVAQNRDRVFMLSILGDYDYDEPKKMKLEKRLKDYLENEVDEKYYLSDKMMQYVTGTSNGWDRQYRPLDKESEHSHTITTREGNVAESTYIKLEQVAQIEGKGVSESTGRVYSPNGLSPTIQTLQGGNREPKIAFNVEPICLNSKVNGKQPSVQDRVYDVQGTSTAITTSYMPSIAIPKATILQRGRGNNKGGDKGDIAPTITSNFWENNNHINMNNLRIRKLTPLECWRLMGISDDDFYKAQKVCSNSQLYKQAGNAIVVDVLEAIFKELLLRKD